MNREDLIRIAHESHLDVYGLGTEYAKFADALERFAALVAAAERERFADECIDLVASYGGPVDLEAAIRARGETK